MQLYYYSDVGVSDENRIPLGEVQELNRQMNCNLYASDDAEVWFDYETPSDHVYVIDEGEFFERYIF